MPEPKNMPVFEGFPDDWWRDATPITELEAADRLVGSWYITNMSPTVEHAKAYRIAVASSASNVPRISKLKSLVASGRVAEADIAPGVRRLIKVDLDRPNWMDHDLVFADAELGSEERVLYRHHKARWQRVFDPRVSISERTMLQLNPAPAAVSELGSGA